MFSYTLNVFFFNLKKTAHSGGFILTKKENARGETHSSLSASPTLRMCIKSFEIPLCAKSELHIIGGGGGERHYKD